jgi:hypothetical protein
LPRLPMTVKPGLVVLQRPDAWRIEMLGWTRPSTRFSSTCWGVLRTPFRSRMVSASSIASSLPPCSMIVAIVSLDRSGVPCLAVRGKVSGFSPVSTKAARIASLPALVDCGLL